MRTNAFVRDLDVPGANAGDGRSLEVVVDGLPQFGGAQLAIDTTLVCALHGDGRPWRGAAEMDGVAILAARRAKERRYPEFVGVQARARLVVLAVEVGGRFSKETNGFLKGLAKARARSVTPRGVLSSHGECDSLGCSGARRRKLWLHLFWRCKDVSALMEHLQRGMIFCRPCLVGTRSARFSWTVFHFI